MTDILQSGNVTPGHLASWTAPGVLQDAGVSFGASYGLLRVDALEINFNDTNTDNPIVIALPSGYTRYRIDHILISGASASISTSTCGVFTAQAAGGTAIVTTGTAVTITATAADTNHNMQSLSINDQDTMFFNDATIFFRTQTAQGSAATANVSVFYEPLP